MLTIVIPMAGRGSRFTVAGYPLPKPLISVGGPTMIEVVIENLRPRREHRFVFLCLQEHLDMYPLEALLRKRCAACEIVPVPAVTQGAACTVLMAKGHIDNDDGLMIANSDQWVDCSIDDYLDTMERDGSDGLIMTMTATDPKWSFLRADEAGWVTEVAEKQPISREATVGIYNFRRGCDFVAAAECMIESGTRSNGEFYVAPVYNQLIAFGRRISHRNVGFEGEGMYGLGTPQDLAHFLSLAVADKATALVRRSAVPLEKC